MERVSEMKAGVQARFLVKSQRGEDAKKTRRENLGGD
jgi:hypothetical protein